MRKIVAALQMSVDGFIEGPNGELDWAMAEDEETWRDIFAVENAPHVKSGYASVNGLEMYYEIHGTADGKNAPLVLAN